MVGTVDSDFEPEIPVKEARLWSRCPVGTPKAGYQSSEDIRSSAKNRTKVPQSQISSQFYPWLEWLWGSL